MKDSSLHNLDNALARVSDKMVHTDKGSFVRVDDLKEAMADTREAMIEEALRSRPRTMREAKRMARQDPELQKAFSYDRMEPPGRSVPATEVRTSSRT